MANILSALCFFAILVSAVGPAKAAVTAYTDEVEYLADIAALGVTVVHEGFEDDTAWGLVRSSPAPSITNLGITWAANNDNSGVTTGSGAALTGDYGFYTSPHGDFANGIGDGFVGTSNELLYGVGGWIETNTPPAGISLVLDADSSPVDVDFGEDCDPNGENCIDRAILGTAHRFFAVISTDGFTRFDFLENEFTLPDEMKLIFADDFTIAGDLVAALAGDYNNDDIVDGADYTVWRDTLGSTTNLAADGNGNSVIDSGDFTVWVDYFGDFLPTIGSGATGAVPEPGTAVLLLVGSLALFFRRRAAGS